MIVSGIVNFCLCMPCHAIYFNIQMYMYTFVHIIIDIQFFFIYVLSCEYIVSKKATSSLNYDLVFQRQLIVAFG